MYSGIRRVVGTDIGSWEYQGEWREDSYHYYMVYFVIAICDDGYRYVHNVAFTDDPEGAERLRQRVEDHGEVDLQYWGFHEFFSLTMEQRLDEEAYHEDLHRRGCGHLSNGCFSEGHV